MDETGYWNHVAEAIATPGPPQVWRRYSDRANASLLGEWLTGDLGRSLKTDLFDEAATGGFLRESLGALAVGIDISPTIAALAYDRRPDVRPLAADVRRLPFANATFDTVISTSTLDHFQDADQIRRALVELHRVLRPTGRLLVTLDNPRNPILALRSRGTGLWRRLGLMPYEMGVSLGAVDLTRALEATGFDVVRTGAAQHVPRLLLVALGRLARPPLIDAAVRLERLDRLPTRYWTGQFVCALARRTGTSAAG